MEKIDINKLTIEEARKLWEELNVIFGADKGVEPYIPYVPTYPQYPIDPWYGGYKITCSADDTRIN